MTSHKAYDQPTKVEAVDGEVTLNGPDGIGVSMTPTAAAITGGRLNKAAVEAAAQSGLKSMEEDDEDDADSAAPLARQVDGG